MSAEAESSRDPAGWVLPHVRSLQPYVPGQQPDEHDWIKLNTNENPFPPSPRLKPAIEAELGCLARYPNPVSQRLRAALGRKYKLMDEQVIVGNGSDDILNMIFRAFCPPGQTGAAMLEPSYSLYPVLAGIQNTGIERLPFDIEGRLDTDAIVSTGARVFFLTSPNAPTGVAIEPREIARLAEAFPGLVVVDEAYGEFAERPALPLLKTHPNILITRSFSKSYGLAGLRVGYALGHPSAIAALDKVRDSYNLDRLAQAGALAALEDDKYFGAIIGKITRIRDYYAAEFRHRGWLTYPSEANFLLTRPQRLDGSFGVEVAEECFQYLHEHRILVRRFPQHPLTAECLRISIGNENDMLTLSETLDQWQKT